MMNGIKGITLRGTQALPVEVEVEITGGLFSITVVGLPDTAVKEARERVRAALRAIGMTLRGRIAINLAPADLPKEGALLDLPMAVGLALMTGKINSDEPAFFLGELALDGRLRWVRGAVPAAVLARRLDVPLFVPKANEREVSLVSGVKAFAVENLLDLVRHLSGERKLEPVRSGAVYTVCGFFCGLAAIVYAATYTTIIPGTGNGLEMNAIAAVIIGGTSMSGGVGTMSGTLIGAFLMSVLKTGLMSMGLQGHFQTFFTGLVVILAVLLDIYRNKKANAVRID